MGKIIDGNALAASVRDQQRRRVESYIRANGRAPGLSVVMVGNDPASEVYVRNKERACSQIGLKSKLVKLAASASEGDIISVVDQLNTDSSIDGIIVQLPLPNGVDETRVIESISAEKDVDGLNPTNLGKLMRGQSRMTPCTPLAVMSMIESTGTELSGRNAVVVGRSSLVGKPLALLLLAQDATVTLCHSKTRDLAGLCRTADILISAAGHPGLITADHVRPGAIVIDVGITRVDGKLRGDVAFEDVLDKAAWISPVPGGVGPMTVTMLLSNTLDACGA